VDPVAAHTNSSMRVQVQDTSSPSLRLAPAAHGPDAYTANEASGTGDTSALSTWTRLFTALAREVRHVLPPTLFFLVGFQLIVLTKQLILAEHNIVFTGFMLATVAALIVGKAVLVADKMPFLRRFDRAPLIQPILFKTAVYWFFVFLARLIEAFVHFSLVNGNPPSAFLYELHSNFSLHRFIATQLWILVLFLIYVTASELNALFGDGELARILFTRRASELQMTRRQRIRELVRLSRLADTHTVDVFRDPHSQAHREVVGIVQRLARQR
jgi:hypothetical protein